MQSLMASLVSGCRLRITSTEWIRLECTERSPAVLLLGRQIQSIFSVLDCQSSFSIGDASPVSCILSIVSNHSAASADGPLSIFLE
jgi:hypothetical protein